MVYGDISGIFPFSFLSDVDLFKDFFFPVRMSLDGFDDIVFDPFNYSCEMHDQYSPDRITDPLEKERLLSCKYYNADEFVRELESEAGHDHDKISIIFLN